MFGESLHVSRQMKTGCVATCFPLVCPPWASKALEQDGKAITNLDMPLPLKSVGQWSTRVQ